MPKWFDANGTDVDAYPDRAFQGGVYASEKTKPKKPLKSFLDGLDLSHLEENKCHDPNHNNDEGGFSNNLGCGNPNCWKHTGWKRGDSKPS